MESPAENVRIICYLIVIILAFVNAWIVYGVDAKKLHSWRVYVVAVVTIVAAIVCFLIH